MSSALVAGAPARRRSAARSAQLPVEHSILLTATLCLLAFGAVMVYSASSPALLVSGGSGLGALISFVVWAAVGLGVMVFISRRGLAGLRAFTGPLLGVAFVLLIAVKLPGLGHQAYGAQRWIGAGPVQFEPSELMKLALVLYAAQVLSSRGATPDGLRVVLKRLLIVAGAAAALIISQPDLGTTLVIVFTLTAMVLAAGIPMRLLGLGAAALLGLVLLFAVAEPYAAARITSFVHPWAHSAQSGYQAVEGQIAIGSGGLFGRGPGASVQKDLYLPNASTDFILAVIGEELGAIGVCGLLFLYGLVVYAGLRTARNARDRYGLLLAAGVTALIASQAILNVFAVLSLAPLTGVPLPLVSYGSSSVLVMLTSMGLLLGVARGNTMSLRVVDSTPLQNARRSEDGQPATDRDRSGWDSGARRAGAGGRGRARHAGR
jgi:cell division protein FtsW